jgi:hypothetical protein
VESLYRAVTTGPTIGAVKRFRLQTNAQHWPPFIHQIVRSRLDSPAGHTIPNQKEKLNYLS